MAGDQIQELLEAPADFARSGVQFMRRCTKPDKAEYLRLCQAVGVGLVVMGSVGYLVKLSEWPSLSSYASPSWQESRAN
ncbi:SecE/Sec61-gamma subunits of protein translocation complex [Geosmithia morbida]|uniref:SecE/Sec61-gamma subunits of protein translocation complex n=1 Tax=Geosmithia morbida TaxID=1094350 RepID=A0A9P5D3C8_9HYPO|nr:SecE/Sec61-gamma subunits of protein translocation complex [Geosmithia morbida]KAF4124802.1 SecE/Sec61-gamma subunits of protein translocation complex [Geosmithia morbida]